MRRNSISFVLFIAVLACASSRQSLQGKILFFEKSTGTCTKSYSCWVGNCGHLRSILLETSEPGKRIVLLPSHNLPFDSFKKFDGSKVEVEVEKVSGEEAHSIEQTPVTEERRPDSYKVVKIRQL